MKVLATIIAPPHLSVSGAARAAEMLSAALASRCDITVASMMKGNIAVSNRPGATEVKHVPVRSWLPPAIPWSKFPNRYSTLFYRSDLPDIIRRGSYDLVHLHNPMPALELERVARVCTELDTPYVVSTHGFNEVANGIDVYRFGPLRKIVWQKLVLGPVSRVVRGAAGIFALSPADFSIVRGMGFAGAELRVVSNGVMMPPLDDSNANPTILEQLGIPSAKTPGQIACMFLANHTPNKGLRILFEAFASLEIPYLLIVGGETRADIDYDYYVRRCRPGQKIVLTGRLEDRQVTALFRRSDLFVFPTLADTFPLAVLEAMSFGVPVLASNVGGIPYQVDEQCGVLVPPGDSSRLASAIYSLSREPNRLISMGLNARSSVTAKFSWERAAEQAFAGYQSILQHHRTCHRASADVSGLEVRTSLQ
jgi:starch synthase